MTTMVKANVPEDVNETIEAYQTANPHLNKAQATEVVLQIGVETIEDRGLIDDE